MNGIKKPPEGGCNLRHYYYIAFDYSANFPMVPGTRLELVQPKAEGF